MSTHAWIVIGLFTFLFLLLCVGARRVEAAEKGPAGTEPDLDRALTALREHLEGGDE